MNAPDTVTDLNYFESTGACFWRRYKDENGCEMAHVFVRYQRETGAQWGNANLIQKHFGTRALEEIKIDALSGTLIVEVKLNEQGKRQKAKSDVKKKQDGAPSTATAASRSRRKASSK
jgi:hypothetical protein